MPEIEAVPWNGYTVASTFSGCGGSCLGYRMAGFKVVWANEFVKEARASYVPNHPGTVLDPRDIRTVKPVDILRATGLKVGELDLFDGSPPCQSFSTAGKREHGWGKVADHADGSRQVSDDLFFEYARLLKGIRPKTFVAENVSGLVKGSAKGYFKLILAELKACGYRVEARVLDAQWLGVPQCRQRVIFVGVRDDLGLDPVHASPLPYRYSVLEACPWIGRCVVGNDAFKPQFGPATTPTPTIMASGPCGSSGFAEDEPVRVVIAGRHKGDRTSQGRPIATITSLGIGDVVAGANAVEEAQLVVRSGRSLANPSPTIDTGLVGGMGGSISLEEPSLVSVSGMGKGRKRSLRSPSPCVMAADLDGSGPHQVLVDGGEIKPGDTALIEQITDGKRTFIEQTGGYGAGKRRDAKLPCPTPSPSGMGGTQSPGNVILDRPAHGYFPGDKRDCRRRSPTVMTMDRAMGELTDGRVRRKFTIAEVKRLCAFPDDFVLIGTFAQQWARLGNSVPPVMMSHIAGAIRDGILAKLPK